MRVAISMRSNGFAYVLVLMLVALMSLLSLKATQVYSFMTQRENEKELLRLGHEFRKAFQKYRASNGHYPNQLEDLVGQEGSDGKVVHYIRKIPRDPITKNSSWGVEAASKGGVRGVYSLSTREPIKQNGFDGDDVVFSGAATYSDWKFNAPDY